MDYEEFSCLHEARCHLTRDRPWRLLRQDHWSLTGGGAPPPLMAVTCPSLKIVKFMFNSPNTCSLSPDQYIRGKERVRCKLMMEVGAPFLTLRGVGPYRPPTGGISCWFYGPYPWTPRYSGTLPRQEWSQPYSSRARRYVSRVPFTLLWGCWRYVSVVHPTQPW